MFEWKLPDGQKVEFKKFSELPLRVFRQIREKGLDDMDALFVLIDAACSKEDADLLDGQPIGALDGLIDAWSAESKVSLPES